MDIKILCQKFCDHSTYFRGYTEATINRYKRTINILCNATNVVDVEEVNKDLIRNFFFHGRTANNWSTSTFITYHKSLAVFFRWCVQEKYLSSDPVKDLEVPKLERRLPSKGL